MAILTTYSAKEESLNAISHAIGVALSIIALLLLLFFPQNPLPINKNDYFIRIFSLSVYSFGLISLFLASTIYHGTKNEKTKKLFKILDHSAIFLLIAGTYTPMLLVTLSGSFGQKFMVLIWLIAIFGIVFKMKFSHRFKKTSLITYLGMGLISITLLPKLYLAMPFNAILLLALGGAIYCFGVIFYVQKHKPYTHAIWHLFVLAGAACHFFMIWLYV